MEFSHEDVDRFAGQIEEQGYTVVENALEPAFLKKLTDTITRIETLAESQSYGETNGLKGYYDTVRVKNLLSRDPIFQEAATFPIVLALVDRFLGPQALLNAAATLSLKPGSREQALHCDDIHAALPRPHRPLILNAIWALSDFTAANGSTRLAPGSHLWAEAPSPSIAEAMRNPNPYPCEQVEMKAGSILVFNGSLWHGGSANRSDERRIGLSINYCTGWMRPLENFQLSIAPKLVKEFSPRLQELCGFGTYLNYMGVIDGASPVAAFEANGWDYPAGHRSHENTAACADSEGG